jgi:GNAT superfamily N-acetyltransferase
MKLVRADTPDPAEVQDVRSRLDRWNVVVTGRDDWWEVATFLREDDATIRGGVWGAVWAGWLHVGILWVDEPLRGQGWGRRLLTAVEEDARHRGIGYVHLDTFSFQAGPEFYRHLGYTVFGELPDHPPGHTHYFLVKRL